MRPWMHSGRTPDAFFPNCSRDDERIASYLSLCKSLLLQVGEKRPLDSSLLGATILRKN